MTRPRLRKPRVALALTAAILCFGVFESAVGTGALPTASLPAYGVTNGDGSLSTVAELGDVNGDGYGDYAVGLPSSDVGGADSGIVYVFLGHAGALSGTPTAINLANASFRIVGHAGEMLGYTVVGNDVNDDGLADIAIGAPMAGPPAKYGGGAVYVIFGRQNPADVNTTSLSFTGLTNDPSNPATPSPLGSRYDGFQQDSHTGMSLAALPDVNGDGYRDLVVGAPDAALHRPGGGGVAVLYGKPQGVHITLNDLWENAYPYFFHVDFPALDDQNIGTSVASVGDMTGDGQPDIAIGAPHADSERAYRRRLGLDHQRPSAADRRLHPGVARGRLPVDQAQRPHGRTGLPHRRRRRRRSARHVSGGHRRPERRRHPRPRDRRCGGLPQRSSRIGRGRRRARAGQPDDSRPRRRRHRCRRSTAPSPAPGWARRWPRRATSAVTATRTSWPVRPARRDRPVPPTS